MPYLSPAFALLEVARQLFAGRLRHLQLPFYHPGLLTGIAQLPLQRDSLKPVLLPWPCRFRTRYIEPFCGLAAALRSRSISSSARFSAVR
jgi:hypothetical protein